MVGSSKNNKENYQSKCFWTQEKETRVKFNLGLSANRPSNNWAQENNKQLMDSFKDLLTETVGQIKRANEYLAEQQVKEIKKLKYNEPRKFKKVNENQVQRIHSAEFCGRVAY